MDTRNFYAGEEFYAHLMLGALLAEDGVRFRTFAPAADKVELLLEGELIPMAKVADGNFWEATISGATAGQAYEYRIWHGGSFVDHADPYAYQASTAACARSTRASSPSRRTRRASRDARRRSKRVVSASTTNGTLAG